MSGWLRPEDLEALWLSLQLAFLTSLSLLGVCTPVALWLARSKSRLVPLGHAVLSMPLVLPPTVLGFYLLLLMGPKGTIGMLFKLFGSEPPVFSFSGLWLASMIVSVPFVIQPLYTAFSGLGDGLWDAAATLGASPLDTFFSVILPVARRGYIGAFVLSFAHTLGEFGVALMVGGNISGRTRVLSTAIFGHVEALDYEAAHRLSAILVGIGFAMVALVQRSERSPPPGGKP